MRAVLQVISLGFAVAVLAALTTNAARDGGGCDEWRRRLRPPQAAKPAAATPAPASAPVPSKAAPTAAGSNRFMPATKAAPVFLPPPQQQPTPQQAAPTPPRGK
jgi:hypothetical protein